MSHPLPDMMSSSMNQIHNLVDANTIVGEPIKLPDGVTIIPVSKVSFGFAGGGSDFATKNQPQTKENAFGGGTGAAVTITPISFLVIKGESVRILPVAEPASNTLDRIIELVPDLVDKVSAAIREKKTAAETSEI